MKTYQHKIYGQVSDYMPADVHKALSNWVADKYGNLFITLTFIAFPEHLDTNFHYHLMATPAPGTQRIIEEKTDPILSFSPSKTLNTYLLLKGQPTSLLV